MANVILTNVTKVHPAKDGGEVFALNGLNLEVQDREFVALTGPPKCGLSTIMRLIVGLDDVSQGSISIGGKSVQDLPPKGRDVAIVFHDHVPYRQMSVRENLVFGLKRRKFPGAEIEKRVLAAAEIVGLHEQLEHKAKSLSSEQCQRLALARAIALQPKVFLFDEPLLGLEAKTRAQMRDEIRKLRQRLQITMIYATHDPAEAMTMGDRLVVLNDGAIQQEGTASEIYDEPENTMVAQFVGSPQMNLIRGTLKPDGDSFLFSEIEGGTIETRLPVARFSSGHTLAGKPVLLGIRPEEIAVSELPKKERYSGHFAAIIDFVEMTSGQTDFHLQTGAHRVICRGSAMANDRDGGHRGQFQLNSGKARLFDPETGRRFR